MFILLVGAVGGLIGALIGMSIKKSSAKRKVKDILSHPGTEVEELIRKGVQMRYKNFAPTLSEVEERLLKVQQSGQKTGKYPISLVYKTSDSDLLVVTPGYTGMWTAAPPLSTLMQFEGNDHVTIVTRKLMSAPLASAKTMAIRYHKDLLDHLRKT